jgi:DAHL domain/Stage II sporulation protein E (SpoIIE)
MNQLTKRCAGTVLVGCAVGVAIALYFKTQPASTEQHTRTVDSFGELHTLDAEIAQETLAARYGIAPNYDPLTRSAQRFMAEEAELEQALLPLASGHPELSLAFAELHEQALERSRAVEHFKTENSVLKNSLYYLPLAAQQVIDAIAAEPHSGAAAEARDRSPACQASEPSHEISKLVQKILMHNLLGGRTEASQVEQQLQSVEGLSPQIPAPALDRYHLLIAHAQTVLRTQQLVDPIVREDVLGSPVRAKLAQLERRYSQCFAAMLHEASGYRTVLYVWSTLLLIAVLGAACKLRSVYARLENLVSKRTHELNQAMQELWGEMELAKKIQTALVPRKLALRGCEVAAIMRPTALVGGDYYDVFEVGGVEWVLIGDVSGHGVPAGLVMMMCQTSVHSVLASCPDIGPDELLTLVNGTLTRNIQRLGEDKYMTMSALRREPDGSFKVAGMHQDLLVYRAASGRVEHFKSEGTWLGLIGNIHGLNPVSTLMLEPGDALVLYTDGITEASRDGKMLDIDGLVEALLAHGAQSAERILAGILEKLESYEVKDDVVALIIKQLQPCAALEQTAPRAAHVSARAQVNVAPAKLNQFRDP